MSASSLFLNHRLNLLVIINVTALTYLVVLAGGFSALDDLGLMHELQQGHVNPDSLFVSGGGRYYRPLLMLSFYMNYLLSGANPAAFHATSLLLHILNASLLYVVCLLILKSYQFRQCGALIAALLFAVTPLNVEAVSWISARTDLLCCLFFLLALITLLAENLATLPAAILFGAAFFCSLLVKEASAPLLIIVPLYLLFCREKRGLRRLILFSGAALLFAMLYAVLRTGGFARQDGGVSMLVNQVSNRSAHEVVYNSFGAIGFYLKKLAWPFPLNLAINSINASLYVPIAILGLVLCAILFWSRRDSRLPLLIVLGGLGPPLLAMHGSIPWTLFAERYLYLPMTGAAMLAGLVVASFWPRLPLVFSFGVVLVFALAANSRAALWADPLALWHDTVVKSPQLPAVRISYAFELINIGRTVEAERFLDKVPVKAIDKEFFWKCRAMVYHQRRDYTNYKLAMLKATEFSANPAELRADMTKSLPLKYRE